MRLAHVRQVIDRETIRLEMERQNKTQAQLGDLLGITQGNASRLVSGSRQLKAHEAVKIAAWLGLDKSATESPESHYALPSADVLAALFEGMLEAIPDDLPGDMRPRALAGGLRLGLELLANNPAIHANRDAIRAIGQSVVARFPAPNN